jgi:hypothetical protein
LSNRLKQNLMPASRNRAGLDPVGDCALALADQSRNGTLATESINDAPSVHQIFDKPMESSYQKNCLIALFGARASAITKNLGHIAAVLVDGLGAVGHHRTKRRQLLQVLTGSGQIGGLGPSRDHQCRLCGSLAAGGHPPRRMSPSPPLCGRGRLDHSKAHTRCRLRRRRR